MNLNDTASNFRNIQQISLKNQPTKGQRNMIEPFSDSVRRTYRNTNMRAHWLYCMTGMSKSVPRRPRGRISVVRRAALASTIIKGFVICSRNASHY